MTVKQLETELLTLTPSEKGQIIQLLSKSLDQTWRGVSKTPGVCGGDACISGTRIPVWVLVNARRMGVTETELLSDYPGLTAMDLANSWLYAAANFDEIETTIQEQEEGTSNDS